MTGSRSLGLRIAHAVTTAILAVAAALNVVIGVVLAPGWPLLGFAFVAVAVVVGIGLWKQHRITVLCGAVGLVLGPVAAGRAGAPVDPASHLTTLVAVTLLYAGWVVSLGRPGSAPHADD